MPRQKRSAFTIIEILVVMGIIAILITLLLPPLFQAKEAARIAKCKSNMKQWFVAISTDAQGGDLPAFSDSGLYNRSANLESFFDTYKMSPSMAFCPSSALSTGNEWTTSSWPQSEPDMGSAIICDNDANVAGGFTTETLVGTDETPPGNFTLTGGNWVTTAITGVQGSIAHYCPDALAAFDWTIDASTKSGYGLMDLYEYTRLSSTGTGGAQFDVMGTAAGTYLTAATVSQFGSDPPTYSKRKIASNVRIDGGGIRHVRITNVGGGGAPAEIVMDNTDATGVTITGAWTSSTSTANGAYCGTNYIHDANAGGGKSVRYTPTLPSAGDYEVFVWYVAASNRATSVPVDIVHDGTTTTKTLNQTTNGSKWFSLGTYHFAAGTGGYLTIRDTGANYYVIADGVKFVGGASSGGSIVWDTANNTGLVDNNAGLNYSEPNGTWVTDTNSSATNGSGRRSDTSAEALWKITIPTGCSGTLQLEACYPTGPAGTKAGTLRIYGKDADNTTPLTVSFSEYSDTTQPYAWHPIGTYQFDAGAREIHVLQSAAVPPSQAPPVVVNQTYAICNNKTLTTYAYSGVLKGATDVNNDTFTAVKVTSPSNGTLNLNTDGSFTYTPTAPYVGNDTFTYKATDGADSNVATVTINVTAPVEVTIDNTNATKTGVWTDSTNASNGLFIGTNYCHDGNAGQGTKNVLYMPNLTTAGTYQVLIWYVAASNRATNVPVDIVHDGTTTTPTVNQQLNGSQWVSLGTYYFPTGTGGYVLIRNTGANGYVVADAVKFTLVSAANSPPTANPDSYTAYVNTPLAVLPRQGVLSNDSDAENNPMTSVLVTAPAHGSLTGFNNGDGSFTYSPAAGYTGQDTFVYKASDGTLQSTQQTVTITVANQPYSSLWVDAIRLTGSLVNSSGGTGELWADRIELTGPWYGGAAADYSSGYHVLEGTWTLTNLSAAQNGTCQTAIRNGTICRAGWYFTVPTAGTYQVLGWWPASAGNANNVLFTIVTPRESQTVTRDQTDTANNGNPRSLGSVTLQAGDVVHVEISSVGTDLKQVVADQVAFVPEIQQTQTGTVIGYLYFGAQSKAKAGGTFDPTNTADLEFPTSFKDCERPAQTPLLIDMFSQNNPTFTSHQSGVNILYVSGNIEFIPAANLKPRWQDTYGTWFMW